MLSSVNGDIRRLTGHVHGQASALLRSAAAAADVRDDEGRPDPGSQAMAGQLENAARQLAQAAALLAQAAREGQSFVDRTVGDAGGGEGDVRSLGALATTSAFGAEGSGGSLGGDAAEEPATTGDLGPYASFTGSIPMSLGAIVGSRSSQGQLGDCGLIAAVDAVRLTQPAILARNCWANPDGTYTVRLYPDGRPVDKTLSASAPVAAAGSYGRGSDQPTPSLVTLYEKAIAVLTGNGYGGLEGFATQDALRLVTGQTYDRQQPPPSLATIAAALERGPVAVVSGALSAPMELGRRAWNQDVVPHHAYAVAGVTERVNPTSGARETTIHLVNPWGVRSSETVGGPLRADELWLTQAQFWDSFDAACLPTN